MEAALSAYLASVFAGPVEVLGMRPLGGPDAEAPVNRFERAREPG